MNNYPVIIKKGPLPREDSELSEKIENLLKGTHYSNYLDLRLVEENDVEDIVGNIILIKSYKQAQFDLDNDHSIFDPKSYEKIIDDTIYLLSEILERIVSSETYQERKIVLGR